MRLTSKTLLLVVGGVCTVLGFVELVIPLMPGVVFFAVAAVCFSSASRTLHRKLGAVPQVYDFLRSVAETRHLPTGQRIALRIKRADIFFRDLKHA